MMPSAPDCSSTWSTSSSVLMSPLAITGSRVAALTSRMKPNRHDRRKTGSGVRPCTVNILMPHSSAIRARLGALRLAESQPVRILSVTGSITGLDRGFEDLGGMDLVAHQRGAAWPFTTFFTGQPKLMSMIAAPRSSFSLARLGHHLGLAAGELDRHREFFRRILGHQQGLAILPHHRRRRDHLGDDEPRPPCFTIRRNGISLTPDIAPGSRDPRCGRGRW